MSQKVSQHDHVRSPQDAARRDRHLAEAFKPLALPALAAAVHMSRKPPRATEVKRDIPAILHEDAILG